jgi:hypothetical protein
VLAAAVYLEKASQGQAWCGLGVELKYARHQDRPVDTSKETCSTIGMTKQLSVRV